MVAGNFPISVSKPTHKKLFFCLIWLMSSDFCTDVNLLQNKRVRSDYPKLMIVFTSVQLKFLIQSKVFINLQPQNRNMKKFLTAFVLTGFYFVGFAQDQGVFSGNLQTSVNFFQRDDKRGANESPQYFSQLSSAESWLFLNYQIKGFNFSARYDLFNNSNLLNPTGSYSGHGLGFWQLKKEIENLEITVGSFYDQFGSGLAFRAYEDRLIGIDYAMEGVKAKYQINDDWFVKAFTGRMKGSQSERFQTFPEVIQGINSEKNTYLFKDKLNLLLGVSALKRTLSTMSIIATEVDGYELGNKFDPKWNAYVLNGYTNLSYGDFNLSAEYVHKTKEAYRNEFNELRSAPGSIYFVAANYSKGKLGKNKKGGIGINLQYRKIDKFQMKISPNEQLLSGLMSYQPSLTRQASYRLLARYNAPAQDYGEEGIQAEVTYSFNKNSTVNLNFSDVKRLSGEKLFREYFAQFEYKQSKTLKWKLGFDQIFYNQRVYEGKDSTYHNVHTLTPFGEVTYKFSKRNSLRVEAQYLHTKEDLGSFINAIVELNLSPHYSFALTDMVNIDPMRHEGSPISNEILHYYTIFGKYNIHTTSFTLAYIKQVQGVNCTGGICRLEPAFSGVRFTLTTNF
jgi:hypothetical protein